MGKEEQNLKNELFALKQQLEQFQEDTPEHAAIVTQYNHVLYFLLMLLESPLSEDDEIAETYLLPEYVEFKREYQEHGPYTLDKLVHDRDVVAYVKVCAVKKRGQWVIIEPLEVFKGYLHGKTRIEVPQLWAPVPWFVKGETCVVFLLGSEYEGYHVSGPKGRMPLVQGEMYLACQECDPEFWNGFPIEKQDTQYLYISWQAVRTYLSRYKNL